MLGCQRGPEAGTLGKSIVLIVLQLSCHPIPHCFSHFFFWPISLDFSSPECFFFFRPTLGHIIRSGQLNSWTAERLKSWRQIERFLWQNCCTNTECATVCLPEHLHCHLMACDSQDSASRHQNRESLKPSQGTCNVCACRNSRARLYCHFRVAWN